MAKEAPRTKNPDIAKFVSLKVIPSINKVLQSGDYRAISPNKLITKLVKTDYSLSELQEEEEEKNPINKLFPYFDELVQLGVDPSLIKETFGRVSHNYPFTRAPFSSPDEFVVCKNFSDELNGQTVPVRLLLANNLLYAPEVKEIKDPELRESARKIVEKSVTQDLLKKFIESSALKFEDPKFESVKTRVRQDLASENTKFYLFGAQICAVLKGQDFNSASLSAGIDLHVKIVDLLELPALKRILMEIISNPLTANSIILDAKRNIKGEDEAVKEKTQIDLTSQVSDEERAKNFKDLLELYLSSQIPYLTMMDNTDSE